MQTRALRRVGTAWAITALLSIATAGAQTGKTARNEAAPRPHATVAAAPAPVAKETRKARLVAQTGHYSMVRQARFSPDGRLILTAGHDGTARLWDAETGKELRAFAQSAGSPGKSDGPLWDAAFSPNGRLILTGGSGKIARLWDTGSGKMLRVFAGHEGEIKSVAFSPDGKTALTGSFDDTARSWDVQTGREIRRFTGHAKEVTAVAFSPDGSQILTGSWDSSARLWDARTGKEVHRFDCGKGVDAAAFSRDGRRIATASEEDHALRVWDAQTGQQINRFPLSNTAPTSVTFSADGRALLTANSDDSHTAILWETATGRELLRLNGHTDAVTAAAFSPDGAQIVTASQDTTARVWNAQTGREALRLTGRTVPINALAMSPDAHYLLTVNSEDRAARLWDARSGRQTLKLIGHTDWINGARFSPDGRFVLTGSNDKTTRLWDVQTGREARRFSDSANVYAIGFSPDSATIVTGNADGILRLWDTATGKPLRILAGTKDVARSATFSPDGRLLLIGSDDHAAHLWDVASGQEIHTLKHGDGVGAVAFSPDGRLALTASLDRTVRSWDVQTGRETGRFATSDLPSAVAFSGDGKLAMAAGIDGVIYSWDVATGKQARRTDTHALWTKYVAYEPSAFVTFSADARYVLAISWDEAAHLYDALTGRELCRLNSFMDGNWAVSDPDGRFDASDPGRIDGLHWVVGEEPIALDQLKERFYEPGLLARVLGFSSRKPRGAAGLDDVPLFPRVATRRLSPTRWQVTLANRGGGIGKAQVYVNDVLYLDDARPKQKPAPTATDTLAFTLDVSHSPTLRAGGGNDVRVVAFNAEGWLSSRGVRLELPAAPVAPPVQRHLFAIVCGISEYSAPELRLAFAARDAEAFARALTTASARFLGAENIHVTLCSSSGAAGTRPATKKELRLAFAQTRAQAGPEDIVVVYLAGHGLALANDNGLYCYLTQDANTTDTAKLGVDASLRDQMTITSRELADWMSGPGGMRARYRVMALDTCAAGAAGATLANLNLKRDVPTDQRLALERFKDRTGFHLLMGCAADRVSYESSRYGQGVLTYALLQGMKGAALRDGEFVDVAMLFHYAEETVPQLAGDIGGIQQPGYQPPGAGSFDIGRLLDEDRRAIPLLRPRPQMLRPRLSNKADGGDDLDLEKLLRRKMLDAFYGDTRGGTAQPAVAYVNAEELDGAMLPVGQYVVEGKTVTVTMTLRRGKQAVSAPIVITGNADDLNALAAKVASALVASAAAPPSGEKEE